MSLTIRPSIGPATPSGAFGHSLEGDGTGLSTRVLLSQVPYALLTLAVLALVWIC